MMGAMCMRLRACLGIRRGFVFAEKARWRGARREHGRQRPVTDEERSQRASSAKTLRAADLLAAARVGSVLAARCGDAPASPPWPPPKSLAAGPRPISKQALNPKRALFPVLDDTPPFRPAGLVFSAGFIVLMPHTGGVSLSISERLSHRVWSGAESFFGSESSRIADWTG